MKMYRFLAMIAAALLVTGCAVSVDESSIIHPVKAGALDRAQLTGAAAGYTVEEHMIERPGGISLHGTLLRQPGAKATVLYFGGNGYTTGKFGAWTANLFAMLGVDLMIVDHRGYGLSTGTASIATGEEDGLAAYDYLAKLSGGPIIVHGHSMGSFIAGYVAAHRPTAAVVLESSATTTEDWVAAAKPGLIGSFLKIRVDESLKGRGNLPNLPAIEEPLLILVGGKDKTTPPVLSQKLYAASPLPPGRKQIVLVPQAGHNDVMLARTVHDAYRHLIGEVTGS